MKLRERLEFSLLMTVCLLGSSPGWTFPQGVVRTDGGFVLRVPNPGKSPAADPSESTLQEFLDNIQAYDTGKIQIEKSVISDPQCGNAYFMDFTVKGFWNGIQAKIDFYVQTLTQENQDRLFREIKANFSKKGLPPCLLQDRFSTNDFVAYKYNYNPDMTTVTLPVETVPIPAGYPCAGSYGRPVTSCWNVQNPY